MFGKHFKKKTPSFSEGDLRCSFCGKPAADVRKLIAGPAVFICDACVSACVDILARENDADAKPDAATTVDDRGRS